jgi:hypothetical protein
MLGWPMFLYTSIGHPVSWLGRLIALGDRHWNDESEDDDTRQSRGTMLALGMILLTGGVALALSLLLVRDWTGAVIGGILAWPLVAARSLHDHVAAVAEPLARAICRARAGGLDDRGTLARCSGQASHHARGRRKSGREHLGRGDRTAVLGRLSACRGSRPIKRSTRWIP